MSNQMESDLKELEQLEDKDIQVKQKIKRDHKIEPDDCFYRVKLTYNNYSKICRAKHPNIKNGYLLVVSTQYGPEIGIVQGRTLDMNTISSQEEILDIIRIATKTDRNKYSANLEKENEAFEVAQKKIKEHNLDMKLINVHYFLEDPKILFNFTADGRIDFRDLVKDLAAIFKTRIELRQIGVRDECRIMSGYGHCGRHFCCSNVADELNAITIKMAKEQNLTLNSLKISGACGRLLCCLAYEYDTYIEEKKNYPVEGSRIKINDEWFFVVEINIQKGTVRLTSQDNQRFFYIQNNLIQFDRNRNTGIVKQRIEI